LLSSFIKTFLTGFSRGCNMINNILLATDGSATSEKAAEFAASLARRFHAKVVVLHAYTPVPGNCEQQNFHRSLYETTEEAHCLVENVAKRLLDLGAGQIETEVVEGPAANVIIGAAENYSPDMIIIGARGNSTWHGMLLGSVSMLVTQRSECPVLIVK
jgi:nucleotide-binding universal stress UspA family protein